MSDMKVSSRSAIWTQNVRFLCEQMSLWGMILGRRRALTSDATIRATTVSLNAVMIMMSHTVSASVLHHQPTLHRTAHAFQKGGGDGESVPTYPPPTEAI